MVDAIAWSAADSLAGIIWNPAQEVVSVSVKGVNNGVEYYSGFSGLSSSTGRMINRAEALKAIGESAGSANAMVALKGNPSDRGVSQWEEDLLKQLKGANVQKNMH